MNWSAQLETWLIGSYYSQSRNIEGDVTSHVRAFWKGNQSRPQADSDSATDGSYAFGVRGSLPRTGDDWSSSSNRALRDLSYLQVGPQPEYLSVCLFSAFRM